MTVFFSNGFEEGDLTAWDGTVGTAPTVNTTRARQGTHSAVTDLTVFGAVQKTLAPTQLNVFFREYIWLTSQPRLNGGAFFIDLRDALSVRYLSVRYEDNAGTKRIGLYDGDTTVYGDITLPVNAWFCLEAEYDANDDQHHVWVENIPIVTNTDARTEEIKFCWTGTCVDDPGQWGQAGSAYFDAVVIADGYIGLDALMTGVIIGTATFM